MNQATIKTIQKNVKKIKSHKGRYIFIDSYNKEVHTDGIIGTITTRVSSSNEIFILEVSKDERS